MTFNSQDYCTATTSGYTGLFEHDIGTGQITIKDTLITDAIVGEARARAELLDGGYAERIVSITCIHIPTLNPNDIINFKGFNWIVKEITLDFRPPQLSMVVKGVRYE